jgi:hypothetical protein
MTARHGATGIVNGRFRRPSQRFREPALERVPEQLQDSIALAWNSQWTRREHAEFR